MKVARTYRIEQETADMLAAFAEGSGATVTEAVEAAIRSHCRLDAVGETADVGHRAADSEAVAALVSQLAEKDAQISRLMDMVAEGTRAVQGAQALHHETAQRLSIKSTDQGKGRWARLMEAWRG